MFSLVMRGCVQKAKQLMEEADFLKVNGLTKAGLM